ncbi:hypothetical protein ACFQWA_16035 [Streptomyces thermogriseus]|uniref:hypothetical protein n=1 Tax=Streptomyces thermogriseus TaxID=75292 RepID=UPI00361398EF
MPTPHGTRGGMAFGAEELRVLRRALALAVHSPCAGAEDVRDCLRLAESLDEAVREGARLRAFLLADLARYRAALPGTAAAYLTLLEECLEAGHRPTPDDMTALQALSGNPVAASLLPRARATVPTARTAPAGRAVRTAAAGPAARAVLPAPAAARGAAGPDGGKGTGGQRDGEPAGEPQERPAGEPQERPAGEPQERPGEKPAEEPGRRPAPARPGAPEPGRRPVPTPGEVFPRRKPGASARTPRQRLARRHPVPVRPVVLATLDPWTTSPHSSRRP